MCLILNGRAWLGREVWEILIHVHTRCKWVGRVQRENVQFLSITPESLLPVYIHTMCACPAVSVNLQHLSPASLMQSQINSYLPPSPRPKLMLHCHTFSLFSLEQSWVRIYILYNKTIWLWSDVHFDHIPVSSLTVVIELTHHPPSSPFERQRAVMLSQGSVSSFSHHSVDHNLPPPQC